MKDLTTGDPKKVLMMFSFPLMGSIMFQQLYNIADSLVAGKFIGENALAAVGNAYEVTLIFLAFAFGCNVGSSVVLAQLFGAKRYRDLKTAVYTTFIASGILCGILMIVGFVFSPALLRLINTPDDIFADTMTYLYIYTAGLVFLFFYNISTGIFSALGDSKTPFYFLAASSTANIAMDIWFVTGFNMGVSGVAWATFICQGISCIAAFSLIIKKIINIKCEGKPALFSFEIFKKITRIAVPSIFQQSFVSVGNIIIQGIVNGFGTTCMAGYAAAVKVNNFAITSLTTLGTAMSNYTAQNLGADKQERVTKGFKSGIAMVVTAAAAFSIIFILLREPLIGLFMTEESQEALSIGKTFLLIVSPFFFLVSIKFIADGVLRGAAAMSWFMTATFVDLAARVILAFLFSIEFDSTGIWLAWPVGWTISCLMSLSFYLVGVWKPKPSRVK